MKRALVAILSFGVIFSNISISEEFSVNEDIQFVRADSVQQLVSGIDMNLMSKSIIPEFSLISKRVIGYTGKEYIYSDGKSTVLMKVGVFPTVKDAEEYASRYLNGISGIMVKDPVESNAIGDSRWIGWGSNPDPVQAILFIRRNAAFIINSHDCPKLLDIAKKIDDDILNHAGYIKTAETYSPPFIRDLALTKSAISLGESTQLRISAENPQGTILEYFTDMGFSINGDTPNLFTIKAYSDSKPGEHIISAWVVSEDNAVSQISKISITF